MKKILFIDRDGTLIQECLHTNQIDSLEKIIFYPKVIFYMKKIVDEFDYKLVMVTNQDGLGTKSFPEETFWPIHKHILKIFENEGIVFSAVHIDRSFPEQQLSTRKPGIDMLTSYLSKDYNIKKSFVIGDRITDVILAQNLGCQAIWININNKFKELECQSSYKYLENNIALKTNNWYNIYHFLKINNRNINYKRITKETNIKINLQLDGIGQYNINTQIGFFDHMIEQFTKHSGINLFLEVNGDLHVDEHHTIEDTGIALGEAFKKALGNKHGISRYGFCLPMDDCLAQVVLDFGGRSQLIWDAKFNREKIGKMPTEMFQHFFKSFSDSISCNLNIQAEGKNEHHKIESIFKCFARAIKMAIKQDNNNQLPTTKGVL